MIFSKREQQAPLLRYWRSPSGSTAESPAPTSRSEVSFWRQNSPVPSSGFSSSQEISPAAAMTGSAAASPPALAITATLAASTRRRWRRGGILGCPLDRRDREVVERVEARARKRRADIEREVDRADDQVTGVHGRNRGGRRRGRGGIPLPGRGVERAG